MLGLLIAAAAVTLAGVIAEPWIRRREEAKATLRIASGLAQPEDYAPRSRFCYQSLIGGGFFLILAASALVVPRYTSNPHLKIESILDGAVFFGIALFVSFMGGAEVGSEWYERKAEVYRRLIKGAPEGPR